MGFNSKSVVDLIEASSGVHFSGLHLDGLEPRNSEVEQPTTSAAEHMHKQPFVIGMWHRRSYVIDLILSHQLCVGYLWNIVKFGF